MANKPFFIVVTGRPGSGKTTFAKKLGGRLFLPVISRDELKEGYVHTLGKRHAELPKETNKYVSELFFETIDRLLSANVSLIAEAAFQHRVWEPHLNRLKAKAGIVILICKPEDDRVSRERFVNRGLENPLREYFHGDRGVDLAASYEEPRLDVPTIHVDTTDAYRPSIDELKARILKGC